VYFETNIFMQQFDFTFGDLNIVPGEAEEFMGFEPGSSPEPFSTILSEAINYAPGLCDIKAGYKILNTPLFNTVTNAIITGGVSFHPGKIVFNQLKGSTALALFLASAGRGIGDMIYKLAEQGDTLESYVFDVLGSVIAQKTVDKLIDLLEVEGIRQGLGISDPYSPGYCDWSVAEQQQLFSFFPEGFCGVTLSASSLMSPIKSVSGIVGIGESMQRKGYQCMMCNDVSCFVGQIIKKKNK
jgi:hypothetical protein